VRPDALDPCFALELPISQTVLFNGENTIAAIVSVLFVVWLLLRQRRAASRLLANRPLISAIVEAVFFLSTAYAVQTLLSLLEKVPLLVDWHTIVIAAGEFVVYFGYWISVARILEGWFIRQRGADADLRLSNLTRTAFYGFFALMALVNFLIAEGFTPAEFYVWTGATAAVLAFIMQQTLGDLFSGLALSLERPFKIGDWLRLSDGSEGQVQDINWRATHLRGWDRTTFVIPNGVLARERFTNLHDARHVFAPWYTVQVSGDEAPQAVIALLEQAASRCTMILKTPAPVVRLMDGNTTPYTYMIWVHFENYPAMFAGRAEVYREVDRSLREAGMQIAADIQEVRYRKLDGAGE